MVNVDGIVPDDMRRGGNCQGNPVSTGYPWEGLQGLLVGARILERAGMPIWNTSDQAFCRASSMLQETLGGGWRASGDDEWQIPFWDKTCGKNWKSGYSGNGIWGSGKNAGFGFVL